LKEKEERYIDEICKEAMELDFWITEDMSDLIFIHKPKLEAKEVVVKC